MLKYRVAEYKAPQPETKHKFFVEIGTSYREKIWWIFYSKKINWAFDVSFGTMEEAIQRVSELKESVPIYHEIK